MGLNIFQISQEGMELAHLIEELEGELTPEIEERLLINKTQLDEKVVMCSRMVRKWDYEMGVIKAEQDRLKDIEKKLAKRVQEMKDRVATALDIYGVKSVEIPGMKIYNKVTEALDVFDEASVPKEYIRTRVIPEEIVTSVDKNAAKEAIKAGEEVEGCRIKRNLNLQIK